MNAVASYLYHACVNHPHRWYPLLGVYYLTYSCDLRCLHCSDGEGRPYFSLSEDTLSTSKVLELLRTMRRHSDFLVLTGGEPLRHPEVAKVLEGIEALRFRGVILTTNGVDLDDFLGAIGKSVQYLVVSLQTLDSQKGDEGYGGKRGIHSRVMGNIERASAHPGRKFEVILSCVVTPGNIPDLYEVYRFARERGFRLAACPQLLGVKAHPALVTNEAYRHFFDFLIAEKKKGASIQGTVDYLEHMRDLRRFSCRPFTMLVVSPTGEVFYPCLELGRHAGNLLETPNLHLLRRQGLVRFGPQPDCDTQCHSACALGFSRLLGNPASLFHEAILMARAGIRRLL